MQLETQQNKGLNYQQLDLLSTKLMVFADASFASNEDKTSQLGYIITMSDKDGRSNILQYQRSKSRRVTRSVLVAELFAIIATFHAASALKITLEEIYSRKVDMVMCIDSKSLFDLLVGITYPTEKRLLNVLKGLTEAYDIREIDVVVWILSVSHRRVDKEKDMRSANTTNGIREGVRGPKRMDKKEQV